MQGGIQHGRTARSAASHLVQFEFGKAQGAGYEDPTFFEDNGACLHTVNVNLDVLCDVFDSCVLLSRFPGHFACGWS